ncbi:MAG: hypothetical protein PHT76_11545 [Anaerostipes sp.]|nr:hypothetical protein [Anaerostipes sp.]
MNEIDKQLIEKLVSVKKKEKFIKHVFCMLKTEEQKKQMIQYIDFNDNLSEMDVMEKMLNITLE